MSLNGPYANMQPDQAHRVFVANQNINSQYRLHRADDAIKAIAGRMVHDPVSRCYIVPESIIKLYGIDKLSPNPSKDNDL